MLAGGQGRGGCDVVVARIDLLDVLLVLGNLVGRGGCRDGGGDARVMRGHDLGALTGVGDDASAEVDLVAIVLSGVVRSGNHDARVGVKGAHREGGERGRVRDGEGQGPTARRRHDARGRTGEIDGAVPGIAADDDARFALGLRFEVGGEARGRTDDDGEVHPGFTRADLATQTRGAELEGPVHRGPQFG